MQVTSGIRGRLRSQSRASGAAEPPLCYPSGVGREAGGDRDNLCRVEPALPVMGEAHQLPCGTFSPSLRQIRR